MYRSSEVPARPHHRESRPPPPPLPPVGVMTGALRVTCPGLPTQLWPRLPTRNPKSGAFWVLSPRGSPLLGQSLGAHPGFGACPQRVSPFCASLIAANNLRRMNGRQLLALAARLQQAVGSGAGGLAAAEAAGSAWLPAQQQLLSLKAWANGISTVRLVAGSTSGASCSTAAAAARRQAGAVGRRGFAADASSAAVARPGPAPRGTSKAGTPPEAQCLALFPAN